MINFGFIKKFNNNNKGMSLVEMLVGIGILSVSVGPLLYMFVYTTKYNAKAKLKQRATNAAVTVMETLKSNGLEKTKTKFDAGTFLPGSSMTYTVAFNEDPLHPGVPGTDISDAVYSISGMKFNPADTKTYDVTIDVTPGTEATIDRTPLYSKYDDVLFIENTADSVFFDPYEVVDYLIGASNTHGVNSAEISEVTVGRRIDVDIVDANTVTVGYSYSGVYKINGASHSFSLSSSEVKIDGTSKPIEPAFATQFTNLTKTLNVEAPVGESAKPLRDVYFYYFPVYVNRTQSGTSEYSVKTTKDQFYFSNNYAPVNVYLFKQKDAGKMDDTRLKTEENRYELEPHKAAGLNYDITLFDAVYANLGALSDTSLHPDIFATVIDGGASANINLRHGLSNTDTIPLTSNITVTITNPSPKPGENPTLAELRGTLLR